MKGELLMQLNIKVSNPAFPSSSSVNCLNSHRKNPTPKPNNPIPNHKTPQKTKKHPQTTKEKLNLFPPMTDSTEQFS